jgi:hypothetical protein
VKTKLVVVLPLLGLFLLAAAEDETARHKEWMDTAQDVKDDLKDALDAKSRDRALEPAEKLVKLGEQEEAYWKKKRLDDVVELAQQNLAASRAIVGAVKEEHFDRAVQAFADLEKTCRACHDLHPERRSTPANTRKAAGTLGL